MTTNDYTASIDEDTGSLAITTRTPKVTCMADIAPREVRWLWRDRIPLGRITLLVGIPGLGKTFVTCSIASRVTTGRSFSDGSPCEAGSVLMVACEDDPADTIRPRLDAHFADASKVYLLERVQYKSKDRMSEVMFTLEDIDTLEETLKGLPDCRLVIIDPIGSYIGTTANSNSDNEVRSVLAPVAKLAERYDVAVIIVAHTRKSIATRADDMVMGSRAFTGIARAVWHLMPDPDDDKRRLLLPGKCNIAERQTGLAFTIGGRPAAINWSKEPVEKTADEILAQMHSTGRKKNTAADAAGDWLTTYLGNGPVDKQEVLDNGKENGHSEKSINIASRSLGVVKAPKGFGLPYQWSLPESAPVETGGDTESPPQSEPLIEKGVDTGPHCKNAGENDIAEECSSSVAPFAETGGHTDNTAGGTVKKVRVQI